LGSKKNEQIYSKAFEDQRGTKVHSSKHVQSKKNELSCSTFFRIKAKTIGTISELFRIEEKRTDAVPMLLVLKKKRKEQFQSFPGSR